MYYLGKNIFRTFQNARRGQKIVKSVKGLNEMSKVAKITKKVSNTTQKANNVARNSTKVTQATGRLINGRALLPKEGVKQNADFVVGFNGIAVPTSRNVIESGFKQAGFTTFQTRSSGMGYILPNGNKVRIMDPAGQAPLRASFTNSNGGQLIHLLENHLNHLWG